MKIIVLVRILWASGAQKIAIEEARVLKRLGHEVKLVFLREGISGRHLRPMLEGMEYEIFSTNQPRWIYSAITGMFMPDRKGEGTLDYNLLKSYPHDVTRNEADYIICHDQWAGVAGFRINKSLGIPYSVVCHEKVTGEYSIPILGKFAEKTEEKVLRNAAKVFGITQKVAYTVQDVYGINAKPNLPGMDLKEYASFKDKKDMLIASATWDKGRDPAKYIGIKENLPEFTLYVEGSWRLGTEYQDFLKFLSSQNLRDRVIVEDNVAESRLQNLYKMAKFNLRYGTGEMGLGTSNIESISHLTPIIVDSNLGISDLILEYGGGKVLDTWDPGAASSFIKENNNELSYQQLQDQLIKITRENTWEKHVRTLININIT